MTKYYDIRSTEGPLKEAVDVYNNALFELVKDMNMINELNLLIYSDIRIDMVKYISGEVLRKIYSKKRITEESYVHINNSIINFEINKENNINKIANKEKYINMVIVPVQNAIFKLFIQETFYFFSIFKVELDDELFEYKNRNSWRNKN